MDLATGKTQSYWRHKFFFCCKTVVFTSIYKYLQAGISTAWQELFIQTDIVHSSKWWRRKIQRHCSLIYMYMAFLVQSEDRWLHPLHLVFFSFPDIASSSEWFSILTSVHNGSSLMIHLFRFRPTKFLYSDKVSWQLEQICAGRATNRAPPWKGPSL